MMRKDIGLATVIVCATLAGSIAQPAWAAPVTYLETGGKESVTLDPEGLSILEEIGLTFVSGENTAPPEPGFTYGWAQLPRSRSAAVRGTDFSFSYDADTGVYIPLAGTEEFVGTFLFDVDTTKLNLAPQLELGDISVRFDDSFQFFAVDTATTDLRFLNIDSSGSPIIDLESQSFVLENVDVLATQEFSDFLIDAGAEQSITGIRLATVRGDRTFVPESDAASVPEMTSLTPLLGLGVWLLARFKRLKHV